MPRLEQSQGYWLTFVGRIPVLVSLEGGVGWLYFNGDGYKHWWVWFETASQLSGRRLITWHI